MTTVFADEYGYNAGDATSALQAAIDDPNADKIVVRDTGSPWLISEQIRLKSNKEIVFEEGSVVQAKPGSFLANDRAMIVGRNIENVKLTGEGLGSDKATLKMNKGEYNSNQYGHIISLLGVDGYEVSGLKLTGAGGDGLHLAAGSFERPDPNMLSYSANGLVENITSDNNRRQGISIDSAKNLVVRNSTFTNTSGTRPSAGISLEPTWEFESLENIRIENVEVSGNEGNGIQMLTGNMDSGSAPVSVDFKNVTIDGIKEKKNAIFLSNKYLFGTGPNDNGSTEFKGEPNHSIPNGEINGTVNFDNINISNAEEIASGNGGSNPDVYVFVEAISGNQSDPENLAVNFNNLNVNDPLDTSVRTTPIFVQGLSGNDKPKEIGNLSFNDVNIQGNYSVDVVRADLLRADSNLNNVSGDVTVFNPNGTGGELFIDNLEEAKNFDLNVVAGDGTAPPVNQTAVSAEPAVEPETEVEDSEPAAEPIEAVDNVEGGEPAVESETEVEDSEPAVVEDSEPAAEPIEAVDNAEGNEVATVEGGESGNSTSATESAVSDASSANSTPVDRGAEIAAPIEPVADLSPIRNSSFTDNLTGWNPVGGNISAVERSPGDSWVKIDAPIGGISQDVSGLIEPGSDYQVNATTQLPDSGTRGYIGVRFGSETNELVSLKYVPVSGNTPTEQQVEFTAPDNFARADLFAFKNNGSDSLFVDDFSMVKE